PVIELRHEGLHCRLEPGPVISAQVRQYAYGRPTAERNALQHRGKHAFDLFLVGLSAVGGDHELHCGRPLRRTEAEGSVAATLEIAGEMIMARMSLRIPPELDGCIEALPRQRIVPARERSGCSSQRCGGAILDRRCGRSEGPAIIRRTGILALQLEGSEPGIIETPIRLRGAIADEGVAPQIG